MKNLRLFYNKETPRVLEPNREFDNEQMVWQLWTLPLGCGQFGASVYGYVEEERIQFTENSFSNPYKYPKITPPGRCRAGVTSFANIYLQFGHKEHTDYIRELTLDDAICRVSYKSGDVSYKREYFTSYPDKAMAMKFTSDRKNSISFDARVEIPYIGDYCQLEGDGLERSGKVWVDGESTLVGESWLSFYDVVCQGRWRIINIGGSVEAHNGHIKVVGADEVIIIFSCYTNYRMESRVFTEPDAKKKLLPYPHPENEVIRRIEAAVELGYDELKRRHIEDYSSLYSRVDLSLGDDEDASIPTDELVRLSKDTRISKYLEVLLFQYGRYLLIASSRIGCLPSNLQGVWSNFRSAPWSAGYWHNINVQMNYWPSCITNLSECFISYSDYNQAYMELARRVADEYINNVCPERSGQPGENGWIIGTGAWPYTIGEPGGHSGPGTGGFTTLLFWDYYDYTRDEKYLREVAYPVLHDMSLFFSRTLKEIDGKYLVEQSASPEQFHEGKSYATIGCAFDQQMIYENYIATLKAAEVLGVEEPLLDVIREQIDKLDPVLIGKSGQVKEFREEENYGDIGEWEHRHVSHLVALYPGTSINMNTPEYLEAAKYSLTQRGDGSSGWSRAHRACLWARAKDAEGAGRVLDGLVKVNIPANLWDQHPPFQIDGNFGYTASVGEMLLQSQDGYIDLLPALPKKWANGSFKGLVARGNFVVDCSFENGQPTWCKITARIGGGLRLKLGGHAVSVVTSNGRWAVSEEIFEKDMTEGESLEIYY